MPGIYIHIPFCRKACHYCDFHFSTNLSKQSDMIDAICRELTSRSDYLTADVGTIYLGGGTPSVLTETQLANILQTVRQHYQLSPRAEVTLEANPEDLTDENLSSMREAGINRLSIGIQTFADDLLDWMNRTHSAAGAIESFERSRQAGFRNISIDLIYALPDGIERWQTDLEQATELKPEHISIYGLTIEPNTVFGRKKSHGNFKEVPEEIAAQQYLDSIKHLASKGYVQYEVSNFSMPDFHSRHNSSYWSGESYLGVGPGAHSYNGEIRRFNIRNNARYLQALGEDAAYFDEEVLSETQRMNERILTQLRTTKGIDLKRFQLDFDRDLLSINQKVVEELQARELLTADQSISLTTKGFLLADEIALKLFFEE